MIHAAMRMKFSLQKIEEALHILHSIVERTKSETGCISCSVYRDLVNENIIVFEEKWESDEYLQRHLSSDEYKKVLLVMELAVTPPEIRFDTVTESSGLEIIEAARTSKKY